MAGSRPSQFKKGGGGRLNNVDGVITGYEFTPVFPFGESTGSSKFEAAMYAILKVRVDGSEEDVLEPLKICNESAVDEIVDHGHTLVPKSEDFELSPNSKWSKLIASLCAAPGSGTNGSGGFDEANLPEDRINYEPIIGARCRFARVKDVETQEKFGKKVDKKTGKEFDRDYLTVARFYGMEKPAGKGTAARTVTKAAGKTNGKAVEVDLTVEAQEALGGLLAKFGGSAPKAKLVSAQGQMFLKSKYPENADAIRKLIYDDDFLVAAVEAGAISGYEQGTKQQTITA